jgi:TPR repeat protein
VELKNAFTSFYDAYYDGYLKMGWSHTMTQARVFTTEEEAIKSRSEVVGKYGSDDWNVLLIKNFTMNDRGDYIRLYEWSKGHAPKKKSSGSSSSSSNKSSEQEKDKPVYVAVNKFTGQRVVCSSAAELREWEAKFAQDNKVADRIQTQQKVYRDAAAAAIRQGADRQSTLQNSANLQKATETTYGTTRRIIKAGERLGNLAGNAVGDMMYDKYSKQNSEIAAAANKTQESRINEIYNKIKSLSEKAQAGNSGALMQLAEYYAKGYSEEFEFSTADGLYINQKKETIVFVPKDIETAYDLYLLAFAQQQTDEIALDIGLFCQSQKREKEAQEWFETAFYLSDASKLDVCWSVISAIPPENDEWCQRAYDLSKNKVEACLKIGNAKRYYTAYPDKYSKKWDELAYSLATSQAEKDAVCEKLGLRYDGRKGIAEAEKWYAKSSKGRTDAKSYFARAKANSQKNRVGIYYTDEEGLKWYQQGIEQLVKNDNHLSVGISFKNIDYTTLKNPAFISWAEQLAAKDATGHIAAGMVKKYGGISAFDMPQRKGSIGGKQAIETIANATPWVKKGVEKNNPYCQFIMSYSNVKNRLNRTLGEGYKVEYEPVVKQKPEEAFKMLNSIVEKKDSAPKYYLIAEYIDRKRGYIPENDYGGKYNAYICSMYSIYTCSMLIIADMYEQGVGVKKNLEEAARWRKLAIAEYRAEQDAIKEYERKTSEITMDLE